MRVMIVVTHLLGTGHLARALTLARAFQAQSHEVLVVSGGMPVPLLDRGDVPLCQLPPLRSDGTNFTQLLDDTGEVATAELLEERKLSLVSASTKLQPDVIITELFPFGRRILKEEFVSLLTAAHVARKRPVICASIRDILAPPSKPAKAELAQDLITQFYDAVLVHSLDDLLPLSLSWPVSTRLAPYLHYTDFVAPPRADPHPEKLGEGEILVTAGGGDVGAELFRSAIGAARLDLNLRWRILVGGGNPTRITSQLNQDAPANLISEPARKDFRQMLNHTVASVSMCGYNTALDILQSGAAAVFVPFDAGGEVEQGIRASALATLDGIEVLPSARLTPQNLLHAISTAVNAPKRPPREQGFDGAERTVEIVNRLVERAE